MKILILLLTMLLSLNTFQLHPMLACFKRCCSRKKKVEKPTFNATEYEFDVGFNHIPKILAAIEHLETITVTEKDCIIIDIDGTAIGLNEWTPMLIHKFYLYCLERGFKIIFLSSRRESLRQQTIADLTQKYNKYATYHKLILLPDAIRDSMRKDSRGWICDGEIGPWKEGERIKLESGGFVIRATAENERECLQGKSVGYQIYVGNESQPTS